MKKFREISSAILNDAWSLKTYKNHDWLENFTSIIPNFLFAICLKWSGNGKGYILWMDEISKVLSLWWFFEWYILQLLPRLLIGMLHWSLGQCWHIEAKTKWTTFRRQHFQTHFLQWKCLNFDWNSLRFVPKGPIDNNPILVKIMAWCWIGDKPLSGPMLTWFTDTYLRH